MSICLKIYEEYSESITLLGESPSNAKSTRYCYRCKCGQVFSSYGRRSEPEKSYRIPYSCGCLKKDYTLKVTHGMTRTPTYQSWVGLKRRCADKKNKDYENYGGRGIVFDPSWLRLENFVADMGLRPEGEYLDRINTDLGYFKDNCRWATITENNNNKRSNVNFEYLGETKSRTQWEKSKGLKKGTIKDRMKRGWSFEEALTIPVTGPSFRIPK